VVAAQQAGGEEAELASYAQDLYRQAGFNLPRSAFQLLNGATGERVFLIHLVSRTTTLSEDLLQAFEVGGAVSQHARIPMAEIVVKVQVEFGRHQAMVLFAAASCCEQLFNDRLTVDVFTDKCLHMQ